MYVGFMVVKPMMRWMLQYTSTC